MADHDVLLHQIEELKLITCSLLPDELFAFVSPLPNENNIWSDLLNDIKTPAEVLAHPGEVDSQHQTYHLPQASFQLKVDGCKLWFDVLFPFDYDGTDISDTRRVPEISVQGEVSRAEQELWNGIVRDTFGEIGSTEYPTYQLLIQHLLPLLHEEADKAKLAQSPPLTKNNTQQQLKTRQSQRAFHALLTSHHLISPTKRRMLQQWSSSLHISGFAKVGYPGVIYATGEEEDVGEFVENVKAMNWLALRVRFVEALPAPLQPGMEVPEKEVDRRWQEFQKVGEVVAEMKRLGREEFILEMGIGSAGAK